MTDELLHRRLTGSSLFDLTFHTASTTNNGNKISIQGKSVSDSIELFRKLNKYLYANEIPFKVATLNRYELIDENKEQSHKAMTIYCVDGSDFNQLCEDVYSLIIDYKGWQDIKTPTSYSHYAGGVYFRNDRDLSGNYVPAKSR